MTLDTLTITFDCELATHEVPLFRGAILNALPADKDVIFHNHQEQGFRYSYPLVQYKRIEGKAAVVFINDGIASSGKLMNVCNRTLHIGRRSEVLKVENILPARYEIGTTEEPQRYRITDWLPLNEQNVQYYQTLRHEEQKLDFLDGILVGNILSFAKGIGLHFDNEVQCEIARIARFHLVESKHVQMMAFDAEFLCNVTLPDHIGLGKHASFGFGQINKIQL